MKLSRTALIISLIIGNIAADQVTKALVRVNVDKGSVSDILGHYLTLRNVENAGAFLGMGSDLNPTVKLILLLILPVIVLGLVVVHLFRDKTLDKLTLIGFSSVVGGGLANVYDRIIYGSVTDFLHIDLGGVFRTGIFNVADMSVTFGMILILWASFSQRKKK